MFGKPLKEITYDDIIFLTQEQQEQEGYGLDYKEKINERDRTKLAKYISSFANSSGGYLIFGVSDNLEIKGVNPIIQNKKIDEWINQIISSSTEPHVFYYDPHIIPMPNSDKVIVVIYIPESTRKPHILKGENSYYLRINDSSQKANHSQIRDMFEFSRNRTDEFNKFLQKRNLFDSDNVNFGINQNSKKLYSKIPEQLNREKPIVLFSLIPKYPNESKLKDSFQDFHKWLHGNYKVDIQDRNGYSLYYASTYEETMLLNGMLFKESMGNGSLMKKYFEVQDNGFCEAGFSYSFSTYYSDQWTDKKDMKMSIFLTPIIGYQMAFLKWAKKYFTYLDYYDEVVLQISFVNMLDGRLHQLNNQYGESYSHRTPSNQYHNNFKIHLSFNPQEITDEFILNKAIIHSEKICRVFGYDRDMCFINNQLSADKLRL